MKLDSVDSVGPEAGFVKNEHEHAVCINGEVYIDNICYHQLLKNSAPCLLVNTNIS